MSGLESIQRGDEFRRQGQHAQALDAYLEAIASLETPDGETCLKLARCHHAIGDGAAGLRSLARVVDSDAGFTTWQGAAALMTRILDADGAGDFAFRRTTRAWLCSSYTTSSFAPLLRLAALRSGIRLHLQEGDYGQYRQEIIDPASRLYGFAPDVVILTVHAGELALEDYSPGPQEAVEAELERWTSLWRTLASRSSARLVMHNFARPIDGTFGHLAARLPGSRASMLQMLNARLGEAAGNDVSIVDCEHLSGLVGKRAWFNDKYWHLSKQAVSLEALPALAQHTAAVIAADLGLGRKCLVLDLDNTLWGGVIGEDGLAGIRLGQGSPEGEAYVAFQRAIKGLQARGVILAVCSKNNDADAREPFLQHPDMLLKLDDFAMFIANWDRKPDNLRRIAEDLNIGLDALVFADDNPAEREIIRQFVPDVEVLALPADPAGYARALHECLLFEPASFTAEDRAKTEQYRARAQIAEFQAGAGTMADFHASLRMQAVIEPFDEMHLPRIVQLLGKTNQFNLTTRRHSLSQVRAFMHDPDCVHLYLKLRDRFADHGLVSVMIACQKPLPDGRRVMDIDTWLMSCRVIGRTVEAKLLAHLSAAALEMGCDALRGTYIPTAKNGMVRDVFARFGFVQVLAGDDGATVWDYDLRARGPIVNGCIERVRERASERSAEPSEEQTVDAA